MHCTHPSAKFRTFIAGSISDFGFQEDGMTESTVLNLNEIKEYIWSKYIDLEDPSKSFEEREILDFFEKHYESTTLETDNENFYYGIILFELGWNSPEEQEIFFYKAYRIFNLYRDLSGETDWDSVEDRIEDIKGWFADQGLSIEELEEKYGVVRSEPAEVARLRELCPAGMVLVPAGDYAVGPGGSQVTLEPFYMNILPVTNEQFGKFIETTKYRTPKYWEDALFNKPDQPVVGVSFFDAMKYAQWAGKDLPTVEQWTAAASGPENLPYPWGAEFKSDMASWKGADDKVGLRKAGMFEGNKSFAGCLDMAGNVWEWTTSWKDPEKLFRIIKGGSFADPPELLRNDALLWASSKEKVDILGFRCIKPCRGAR